MAAELADERLCTNPGRLWFENCRVLVVRGHLGTMRELLRAAQVAVAQQRPLVVVCAGASPTLVDELVANRLAGTLVATLLLVEDDALEELATTCRAAPMTVAELRAGCDPSLPMGQARALLWRTGQAVALSADTQA